MSIFCKFYNYDKKEFRELEVDCRLNVYPCCYISNVPANYLFNHNLNSTTMKKATEEIQNYFNEHMWNGNEPYYMCQEKCSKETNDH